ncbi:serine hydrolase [Maricaulis sp.]|uniref:serine hydrolase domain-containing protein n=1 Tax=Maricaulis sp. TaxID=1486257 RepID=UPI0026230E85|nr:serine hydrolase [Maricaulis sp.]
MKISQFLLAGVSALGLSSIAFAQETAMAECDGSYPLATASNPASLGWTAEELAGLEALANELQSTAMMVVQGGEVVFSHGETERLIMVHSLRKSLMSALIGFAVDQGALDLDATLADLGIDDLPGLTEQERAATVRDVIMSRSGVYIPSAAETPQMRESRPERGQYAPGEHWYYNNWDFNVAGHIFERVTNRNYNTVFDDLFAQTLCMPDFDVSETYRQHAPGTMFTAYHMRTSARDMALFGQLFLQNGQWNGQAILSEDWVSESTQTTSQTGWPGPWMGGYGYMWWRPADDAVAEENGLPADMYTGAGYGGQYVTVVPSLDLVIVNRMNTDIPDGPRMGGRDYTRVLQTITAAAAIE